MTDVKETLFGVRTLTGMIQTFKTTDRERFFSGLFEQKGKRDVVEGNTFEWDEMKMSRELAPVIGSQSPAVMTPVTDRNHRVMALLEIKHFTTISADRLYRERGPGELKSNAKAVVAGELMNLRGMIDKTKEYCAVNTLLGSLVVNSTNIPNSDQNFTITIPVDTYTRGAKAWSDPTSQIASLEVPNMVDQYVKDTGMEPGMVLHNVSVETSMLGNIEIQDLCANQQYAARILEADARDNRVLQGLRLGNLDWRKSIGYYTKTGTKTRFMPDNKAIVLPDPSDLKGVLGVCEGSGFIPLNAYGNEGDLGMFRKAAPGYYAWSVVQHNPVGIQLFAGWRGLYYILFPTAVMAATLS